MLMVLGPLKKKTEARAGPRLSGIVAPPRSGWPTQRPSERSRADRRAQAAAQPVAKKRRGPADNLIQT